MTTPNTPNSSQQGTTSTGGILNVGTTTAAHAGTTAANALGNVRTPANFPTLNPPVMKTLVYAPDVEILIAHDGIQYDISKDIVRGQVVRKENAASSLFVTVGNNNLRYNATFARMDRIICNLTRINKLQVFSGYLDTIPWFQAYPGTVDFRATCTIKRLLHTWWNPALPGNQQYFQSIGAGMGLQGDGQGGGVNDGGIGGVLQTLMYNVGNWTPSTVHVQNFPMQFLAFANAYMAQTGMQQHNANIASQFNSTILGDDLAPGPMGAVGYAGSDPIGTAASVSNSTPTFYLQQICSAVDQRGMGPLVDQTANSQQVAQTANTLESATATPTGPGSQALAQDVHQAGQQLGQFASNWSTQNTNSDAAILALACVIVESGNGTPAILLQANPADPPTLTFWHDGEFLTGTGSGLFNQPNNGNWGTPAQRMNPLSSAGMFLDALNAQTGWRNMDPGQAIWQVMQNDSSKIAQYDAAITQAQTLVAAYRKTQQGASSATSSIIGQIPGASAASSLLGGGANPISTIAGAVTQGANSPVSTAASVANAGGPNPNSEGALNAAATIVGTPYKYGGTTPGVGIDCSALVMLSFGAIGVSLPRDTYGQKAAIPPVPIGSIQRGDVLQTNYGGHTGIYLGGGTWIQTGGPDGVPGSIQAVPQGPSGLCWAGRVCQNGGVNPGAPFTPVTGANPATGLVPGTGIAPGQGTGSNGAPGGGGSEPIARNLFAYMFEPAAYSTVAASYFTGERSYIDDVPLIQTVKALCMASLRNFQSAPNGDFIAYYPDPFGMDGKPAILALEDIELKDCSMILSDDNLTTHVYIEGDWSMLGQADQVTGWLSTCGVATIQTPFVYQQLTSIAPGDFQAALSPTQLMYTYGVRPYKDTYQIAGNSLMEFMLACQIFMGKWASQYETDIGLTFMPELFPGMRISLTGHNLTVYCSAVTHVFDWEKGFATQATVSAPANPQGVSNLSNTIGGLTNLFSTKPGNNTSTAGQPVNAPVAAPVNGGPINISGS